MCSLSSDVCRVSYGKTVVWRLQETLLCIIQEYGGQTIVYFGVTMLPNWSLDLVQNLTCSQSFSVLFFISLSVDPLLPMVIPCRKKKLSKCWKNLFMCQSKSKAQVVIFNSFFACLLHRNFSNNRLTSIANGTFVNVRCISGDCYSNNRGSKW